MLDRRHLLAIAAAVMPWSGTRANSESKMQDVYFVPGGRIGVRKPPEIKPYASSAWRLLAPDHTLAIQVSEFLRLGAYNDSTWWDKDDRHTRIDAPSIAGFEVRRFRDLRYDPSPDYMAETVVLRDDTWMGEVDVSVGNLGSPVSPPGGQNARWRALMDTVLAAIVVRPRLPIADALAELNIKLDTDGLNPRLVGEKLILSLYTPKTASDAWGSSQPTIRITGLALQDMGLPGEEEKHLDDLYRIAKRGPHQKLLSGNACRGILHDEIGIIADYFATSLDVYGRTRTLQLTAFYNGRDRGPMLDALNRVFQSLELRSFPH